MIFRLFVVILAIGSVNCDCTGTIFSCAKNFGSQVQSGANLCPALRSYIHCFFPECNLGVAYEDASYNNILNAWRNIGIHCDSTWSDISDSFQDGLLLGGSNIAGLTTPGNSASCLKTLSSVVFMLLSFLRALS